MKTRVMYIEQKTGYAGNGPARIGRGGPISAGACFQAGFLLFSSLSFDSGQLLHWILFSIVTYWLMAAIIISRRPQEPTEWDLIFLRSGFVVILPVVICLTSLVYSWRGLL